MYMVWAGGGMHPPYPPGSVLGVNGLTRLPYNQAISINVSTQGELLQPPWILVFPTEFFCDIFHGYSFEVKESKGDS